MPTDAQTLAAFDRLFDTTSGTGELIDYRLAAPRWQFICHIVDTRAVVLHGSGQGDIRMFEPRQPDDITAFGNQNAVYAASDGLWPMYFAILDRDTYGMSLINAAIRVVDGDGRPGDPFYFFSITDTARARDPFRSGTIYFLPRETFRQQPRETFGEVTVDIAHWASLEPVKPLAKITVGPDDFPLLAQIRGHDNESTFARARANPSGFPWLGD
jgi:hypothetical protein